MQDCPSRVRGVDLPEIVADNWGKFRIVPKLLAHKTILVTLQHINIG